MKTTALATVLLATATMVAAQQAGNTETSAEHHAGVTHRGDQEMGFSHEKTTHHFRLCKDGGVIEVSVNDPKDSDSRDMIRMHLTHIAEMFAAGDFDAPMFIHATNPTGVPTMTELKDQIEYKFEETDSGGRVRIRTANPKALEAVHQFLRFQITEHETGDSTEISERSCQN